MSSRAKEIAMSTTAEPRLWLTDLRERVKGEVITSGDAEYDTARRIQEPEFDQRPAAIVRPLDADDVAQAIMFAKQNAVELAVRSGGHSVAGHSTTDDGIVLDLSMLKALEMDVEAGTVWAETGLTAGEVARALGPHGFAVGFGDTGSVGIGGLTLGGGIGFFVRKHGLTIDNLLAAEVVTADGRILHVDRDHYPDLFWAIRGGGGNFGVATRFKYQMHPVDLVTGGVLVLPANERTIAELVAFAEAAPEDLSLITNVLPAPPLPFIPASHVGQLVMLTTLVHSGTLEEGERDLAVLRAIAEPVVDLVGPMPYAAMFPEDELPVPSVSAMRTTFIDRLDTKVAADVLGWLEVADWPVPLAQIRVLGGAVARVPADATAFAHRTRPILLAFAVMEVPPEEVPIHAKWSAAAIEALRQGPPGAYVNFSGDDSPAAIRVAYPYTTLRRLTEVKRRYDPDNLFRLNHNVPPSDA
jgi:FAD/FMN-containing dehydrogenase